MEEKGRGRRSKILASSSFSNFFFRQSGRTYRNTNNPSSASGDDQYLLCSSSSSPPMDQNKKKKLQVSDHHHQKDLSTSNSSSHDDDIIRISLREWLQTEGNSDANMIERMCLFKRIVEIVDSAHSQGIAFLELHPSSFLLFPGDGGVIKYVGSVVEVDNFLSQEIIINNNTKKRVRFACDPHDQDFDGIKKKKIIGKLASDDDEKNVYIIDQMEKKWYACPEGIDVEDILPFNVYCLGLLLFELCCNFESIEVQSAAMVDLQHRILPPNFLSESPKEAGFCFWLLHPEPSSRPTTREILQSELIYGSEDLTPNNGTYEVDYDELDLLLHFLVSLQEYKQNKASKVLESIQLLETDIKEVERMNAFKDSSDVRMSGSYDSSQEPNLNNEIPYNPLSRPNVLRNKLLKNINQLEDAYFCMRSHLSLTEVPDMDRSDKDMLRNLNRLSRVQAQDKLPVMEEKSLDRVGTFFDGICKFSRYEKFEVLGTLRNGDMLNSDNVICSLSFDREEEYIAAAGVSKKIKIFELSSLLNGSIDIQYPVLEISNESKFSCICWNGYVKNYLASTDYDGVVQIWDASSGQEFLQYKEHQKRAWSVDFSQCDPTRFASGSDDCSVRIWNMNERSSMSTIWSPANVCCVQFSPFSSHLLAFGSADYKIYCYDLRLTKIPWCTLAGHGKAVSYVRFLDSETLISASTDSTLKLWDLKKTCLEGLSQNACHLTFSGHANEKNFVGLTTKDGYIACGSETNEVYAYYRSLPMPITSHNFGCIDPISGHEVSGNKEHFVSSVCWRRKAEMLAAANSSGCIEILHMV